MVLAPWFTIESITNGRLQFPIFTSKKHANRWGTQAFILGSIYFATCGTDLQSLSDSHYQMEWEISLVAALRPNNILPQSIESEWYDFLRKEKSFFQNIREVVRHSIRISPDMVTTLMRSLKWTGLKLVKMIPSARHRASLDGFWPDL